MSKPKLGYLLFDLPSDHEIESSIATECEMIEALLHNRNLRARVKRIRVASATRLRRVPQYRYDVQFVHLACHGGSDGISFLGGEMKWKDVARQIRRHLHPLNGKRRVIVFSCCHSRAGFEKTRFWLEDYFTGAYFFDPVKIGFPTAMTTWLMFYLKKNIDKPHEAIVDAINGFLGSEVLKFKTYD